MSGEGDEARQKRALAVRPGYEVGYGKPPEATRFRKGQSGNPNGRPRGARNKLPALHEERIKALILEEAYRTIRIRDGERSVSVPIVQAVLRAIAVNALKGHYRSQRLFTEMVSAAEESIRAAHEAAAVPAFEYKIIFE